MRGKCKAAADQRRDYRDARVEMICRGIRHYGTSRDADKSMDNVPNAVEIGNLVRKKLDRVQSACNADDPPVVQCIEAARQLRKAKLLQQAEDRYRCVQIDA